MQNNNESTEQNNFDNNDSQRYNRPRTNNFRRPFDSNRSGSSQGPSQGSSFRKPYSAGGSSSGPRPFRRPFDGNSSDGNRSSFRPRPSFSRDSPRPYQVRHCPGCGCPGVQAPIEKAENNTAERSQNNYNDRPRYQERPEQPPKTYTTEEGTYSEIRPKRRDVQDENNDDNTSDKTQ